MSTSPTAGQKRARPSMASYLLDSDDPILIATNFPKKARPATPPASMRYIPTSWRSSSTSTSSLSAFPALELDLPTFRPLVGLLVKDNGDEIPFLIPRPNRPFRLPEGIR